MEPTLYEGDVLVVRKSDGLWQRWTRRWRPDGPRNDDDNDGDDHQWAVERGRVLEWEQTNCRSGPHTGWVRTPPVPVTGDVVVFRDPERYPSTWNVKRVIGLGGQTVLSKAPSSSSSCTVLTMSVPPYSLWVEGDNADHSRDSRDDGPVSKKLLVGIVEYRVWPPWRMGKLLDAPSSDDDDDDDDESSLWVTNDGTLEGSITPKQPRFRPRSFWP
jgi:inner membrane protease subunit 1